MLCFGFSSCVSGFCDFCAWLYACSPAQMYPVCVPHVCFWQSILGVHSAATFVCACACEANGGLLSGQRWIWGSLGPWSVQAFTLTPSMWPRACVLSGCEWDVVCVCLSTCMFFHFFHVTTFQVVDISLMSFRPINFLTQKLILVLEKRKYINRFF